MGKAKRQLAEAHKAMYETQEDTPNTEYDSFQNTEGNDEYLVDTSVILRANLIEYAQKGAFPLCEHLDIQNVHNFVIWLLKK